MQKGKLVAGLEVVTSLLDDPKWGAKAKHVRTLRDLRQIIYDFCKEKGEVVSLDDETLYCYI